MLFTGFCDKNGRRVFQGDVVRALRAQRRGRAIVGYEEMFCEVLLDAETQSFRFGSNQLGWSALSDVAAIYEVVGNRFEDPELLTRINSSAADTLQLA
jgi:uncharacterized phage protein (TIGR01671 family)